MNPLMARLKKASKIAETSTLAENEILGNVECAHTGIPCIDIAFCGALDGGVTSGLTLFCGESRVFKSVVSLVCAKAYLDKYDDAVLLFYDSEMGASKDYFESVGIDPDRVLYTPITDVEVLKFDLMSQLEQIKRGDHVVIVVDSIGNLASKKEVEDALAEKSAADMTRAKQFKSLTRMITPHLNLKNIPMIVVAHVYKEIGCLSGDTEVITSNGVKKISDIAVGDFVATPNGYHIVNHVFYPQDIPTEGKRYFEVELEDGSIIHATGNHQFMVNGEWKRLDELKVGDNFSAK